MPGLDNIKSKLIDNHLLIIAILILILILYLSNTSKTQVLTTSTPQLKVKNETFLDIKKNNNKAQFTVYYTSWCGWSKKALSMLNQPEMIDYFKNNSKCELVLIDCESENGKNICDINKIEGFPTMKLINGNASINYNGERTPAAIKQFINSKV